jgi:hypothetical protein
MKPISQIIMVTVYPSSRDDAFTYLLDVLKLPPGNLVRSAVQRALGSDNIEEVKIDLYRGDWRTAVCDPPCWVEGRVYLQQAV